MNVNSKQTVELFMVVMITTVYSYMVLTGKAPTDGYVFLAGYVVKKFLDLKEEENKNGGTPK